MNYFGQELQQGQGGTPFVRTAPIQTQQADISEAAFAARDRDPLRVALSVAGDKLEERNARASEDGSNVIGIFSKLFGG